MARFARERRAQEGRDDVLRQRGADDARADAQHVHVVVLDRLVRGVGVVTHRGADAGKLVGGNRHAGAAATDDDAAVGVAVAQRLRDGLSRVGVVAGGGGVRPEIQHRVPFLAQNRSQIPLQFVAGVVGAEGQTHRARLLYFRPMRNTIRFVAVAALALLVTSGARSRDTVYAQAKPGAAPQAPGSIVLQDQGRPAFRVS